MALDTRDIWDTYFGSKRTILNFDYDADGFLLYEGKAEAGTASSAAKWLVRKYTISNRLTTQVRWAPFNSIWDNRASLSYE